RPATFPHSLPCDTDLSESTRSTDHITSFRVCRYERHDVRPLLLVKELVGDGEISRRLDDRLHSFLCTPLDTITSRRMCVPVDTGLALVMREERTCSADATVSYLNSSHPYFNSSSRGARRRRSGSCDAR